MMESPGKKFCTRYVIMCFIAICSYIPSSSSERKQR
uniref:Uncharacterized protein n=1 Tax=Brassica oleracea TaxID=3712 RepID=A0A3P6ETS1_BRAOL|nr:unnamed protein product [Brassica oleracea]